MSAVDAVRAIPAHQKRRGKIATKRVEKSHEVAEKERERARLLLTESKGDIVTERDIDRSWKAKQRDILEDADDNTKAKVLNLELNDKYSIRFSRNGRFIALGGTKGHLAVIDALRSFPKTEVSLENETVHDVTFLQNETLFAAAQRKYVYIYDHSGTEVHQLRSHIEPRRLEFLPYHYLLASVGRSSRIAYQDISTGALVASLRTRMGPCSILAQNPRTAVLGTGHSSGIVAMWAPTNGDALLKVLCHPAPLTALAFNREGTNMVTSALDGRVSIWDVRALGKTLNTYALRGPKIATCLSISDTGLVAIGTNREEIQVWKDVFKEEKQTEPYLFYHLPSGETACSLHFRPFEDVLGIGYSAGVKTIIVPGAGEANFDAFEANPFERKSQRRETEVKNLLDKLPADTIGLEQIGAVFEEGKEKGNAYLEKLVTRVRKSKPNAEKSTMEGDDDEKKDASLVLGDESAEPEVEKPEKIKKKMKGRGKIGNKLRVKHRNIITVEREKARLARDEMKEADRDSQEKPDATEAQGRFALSRFKKQRRS